VIDSSQQNPSSEPVVAQPVEAPTPPPTKKSNRNLFLIIGGVLLLFCVCAGACLAVGGAGAFQVYKEKAPVGRVLDSFMRAMVDKDADKALSLFSSRAQKQMSKSDLEKMWEGNNYVLFEGYQSLEIGNLNISKDFNTNQNLPQGTVAKVDGTVSYQGSFTGHFDAVLEKEGDTWRLFHINVVVPPDKVKP
jgi:hypothetical protein